MKYEIHKRVRYSEIDMSRQLKLSSIINYFQDCSTFHSEDVGVGLEYLESKQRAWILLAWQILIERRANFGEKIVIGTWATDFTGIYGKRNFQMSSEDGESLVKANSVWVYMDTKRGRPCKPDMQELEKYGLSSALEMQYTPRKIETPDSWEELEPFPVRHYHIDTNGHVNNSQYIQMAQEFLSEGYESTQVRVEYKRAAVFGDIILPRIARDGEQIIVELCDLNKGVFAIVEFTNVICYRSEESFRRSIECK